MEKRFVTITRAVGQPWGINLRKVDNKFTVESVNSTGPGSCLEKGDVIESINNVPLSSLSSADIKPFFDAILTANVWYFRKVISVISLLDDDDNNVSGVQTRDDDFWSDFPAEFMDDGEEEDDYDRSSSSHYYNDSFLSSFGGHSGAGLRTGGIMRAHRPPLQTRVVPRTAPISSQPVVIDLISDDEEPPRPPSPPRQSTQSSVNNPTPRQPSNNNNRSNSDNNHTSSEEAASAKKNPKDAPTRTHIGSIKIKQEFEPKKFGEANYGDEVVEVMPEAPPTPPTLTLDGDGPTASKGEKRKFGEAFTQEDDEIQFVGGNMQVAADMPHQREACPRCHFERYKEVPGNLKFCSNCYCFICEVKASECLEWKKHCHAHCKDIKWKKLRDTNNIPILRLMTPAQKSAFLAKYRTALNAVEDSRYSDDEYDYDSWDEDDEYYGYGDSNVATNNAFTESVAAAKKFLAKPDLTQAEYLDCTALVLNAIRLVSYNRSETVIDLSLSWIAHSYFTQQYNDLLIQQLHRRGYPRINWLTGLANLIVKAKVDPNAVFSLPHEVNHLPDRSFVKVIRKLSAIVPMVHLRPIIDRHPSANMIPELILEYLRSNESGLQQLIDEYLSKANLQTVADNFRSYCLYNERNAELQPRSIILLICLFLDSNRSARATPRSVEATDSMIQILFNLLLKNALQSAAIPQTNEITQKMIQHSAISVLIENPNLQIKTWAENRIATYSQQSNADSEELELVLIVTMIILYDLIRRIHVSWNNSQTWGQQKIHDQLMKMIPTSSMKTIVILANLCLFWSLSPLVGQYEEASFSLACEFAKQYFRQSESTFAIEMMSHFHPKIFHELARIPEIEFVARSPDLGVLMQFQIHLDPQSVAAAPITNDSTTPIPMEEVEKTILVEYLSCNDLLTDLFKPSQSSAAQSRRVLGQSLSEADGEKLYNWLSRYYFSETRANLSEFLKSCEIYFLMAMKGVLLNIWRTIVTGESAPRMSRTRHFLDEVALDKLFEFPLIAACQLLCKMRKNCDTQDSDYHGLLEGIVSTKTLANKFLNEFKQYKNAGNDSSSQSQSTEDMVIERELCKLFFMIYPIDPREQLHQMIWEYLCKPYFKDYVARATYLEPDISVYLMLEMWDSIKTSGMNNLHLLSNVKMSDLQWQSTEIVPNLTRLLYMVQGSLISMNIAMKAINYPHSVLAKLYELCTYTQITNLINDRSLIAYKVLALHECSGSNGNNGGNEEILVHHSANHATMKQMVNKIKGDLTQHVNKSLSGKPNLGYLLYYFVAALYLGLNDCAQSLLPHLPESLTENDGSIYGMFHSSFRNHDNLEDYFYYILFMNLIEERVDGAIQVCMERLRRLFSTRLSTTAKNKTYNEIFARFQIILDNPNRPGRQKSYIAEAMFYYHYDEKSMKSFHQIVTSSLDSAEQSDRLNRVKQWLQDIQQKGKEGKLAQLTNKPPTGTPARTSPHRRYPSSSTSSGADNNKEKYRTIDHYTVLSYLVHPIELFRFLVEEFNKEKQTIQQLLAKNPQLSLQSGPSTSNDAQSENVYYECEKILLVAVKKSKLFFTESMMALRDVVSFFFDAILFLKNSMLEIRKKCLNSLDKQYFLVNEASLTEDTRFRLAFLRVYREVLKQVKSPAGGTSTQKDKNTNLEGTAATELMELVEIDLNQCDEESSAIAAVSSEKNLSQLLQDTFRQLSQQYPQWYQLYKNQMIDCFLFPEDPASTFFLLLENRVYELLPDYLHRLEVSYNRQHYTLSVMANVEKITTNLTMLFQAIQLHHFLPATQQSDMITTTTNSSDNNTSQDILCLQEFINNPKNLLLQLFVYLSEVQYRYLSSWDTINDRDDHHYGFMPESSLVSYHKCRKILKEAILHFIKSIKPYFHKEPCLNAFIPCLADFCTSATAFVMVYYQKASRNTAVAPNSDPILSIMFSLSKKRMHYSAILEYLRMIFALNKQSEASKAPVLPITLFQNPQYYQQFMDNIFLYPLMTDLVQTELSLSEEILSEGLLSLKTGRKSDREITHLTKTFTKLFDDYGSVAISALGKGFILYVMGFIPQELAKYHKFSFVDDAALLSETTPHDKAIGSGSSANFENSISTIEATSSSSSTSANDDDVVTYTKDKALQSFENYYCVVESDRKRIEELGYTAPVRINKKLMLQEPPETSTLGQLYKGSRYHSSRYGYNLPQAIHVESNTMVKILRDILTRSAYDNKKFSSAKVNSLDHMMVQLIEKFDVDNFQKIVREYYDAEEELFPYILSFCFALFQKMMLQKSIRALEFIQFYLTCHRNHYSLPSRPTLHSSTASTSTTSSRFDRSLVQAIYQTNTKKLCHYFQVCYTQTFDAELSTASPTVINSLPLDTMIEIPELVEMITSFGGTSFQELSLSSLARRRPIFQLISKMYVRKNSYKAIQDFADKLLLTFEQVVRFCRSHTMDKNKKANLTDIVATFRTCFDELSGKNPDIRKQVNQKKAELLKSLKSKKPVYNIFQEL